MVKKILEWVMNSFIFLGWKFQRVKCLLSKLFFKRVGNSITWVHHALVWCKKGQTIPQLWQNTSIWKLYCLYDFYVNSKTCQFFLFFTILNFKITIFFFTIFTKNCRSGSSACTWHTILCKNCQVWVPYFDVFATYPCETSDIFLHPT